MLNIHDLESRWLKYKIKSYIPYIVIFFSVLIIGLLFYIILPKTVSNNQTTIEKEPKIEKPIPLTEKKVESSNEIKDVDANKSIEKKPIQKKANEPQKVIAKEIKKEIIEEKKVIIQESKQEKITLKPSLSFMKEMNNNNLPYYNNIETNINTTNTNTKTVLENEEPEEIIEEKPKEKPTINIEKRDLESDIAHVIKRFNKNHNPALSLFAAKKYYELGDYKKAYNYSLITNNLNNKIEISWIIFAKSLVKLKQKNKAIETLTKYVKYSNSSQAGVLLDDIKTGKFK